MHALVINQLTLCFASLLLAVLAECTWQRQPVSHATHPSVSD